MLAFLLALICAVQAATINYTTTIDIPSNAPPAGRFVVSARGIGKSDETIAYGATWVHSSWTPLDCEIISTGDFYLTVDLRDSANWPTIPSTATCSAVFGSDTHVLTVTINGHTVDYVHDGTITNIATGANFALGTDTKCAGAVSVLDAAAPAYQTSLVTATKTGGAAWTAVTCQILADRAGGGLQDISIQIGASGVASTGYCRMPKVAGGYTDVPITITR